MTILEPNEVLKLIEKRDGVEFSRYLKELSSLRREEWLAERYAHLDFSGWDTFHAWLMGTLGRDKYGHPLHEV